MNNDFNPMSYIDTLRETQQAEFPLLSTVTQKFVDEPLTLMNAHTDDDGMNVPCALPHTMVQCLPEMMREPLSLYDDADLRTMLLGHDEHLRRPLGIRQGHGRRCGQPGRWHQRDHLPRVRASNGRLSQA